MCIGNENDDVTLLTHTQTHTRQHKVGQKTVSAMVQGITYLTHSLTLSLSPPPHSDSPLPNLTLRHNNNMYVTGPWTLKRFDITVLMDVIS